MPAHPEVSPSTSTDMVEKAPLRKRVKVVIGVAVFVVVAAAIAIPLALTIGRKGSGNNADSNAPGHTSGSPGGGVGNPESTGRSGSLVTIDDGTTFTYVNDFGGDWAADPGRPFVLGGKAQSWSPRVGVDEWVWGQHVVRGVNLGYGNS